MASIKHNYKAFTQDKNFEHGRWKERVTWLLENYGPIGERWDYNGGLFFFLTEKDKMIFVVANT
jgi:hypothetical protein